MSKQITLDEGYLDANLRPLKIDGELTSLEVSNGSGARISGGLEVTGPGRKMIAKTLEVDSLIAGPETASGGTLYISAASETQIGSQLINLGYSSSQLVDFNMSGGTSALGPSMKFKSILNTADYMNIETVTNGATTISTVDDSDDEAAHLTFDIQGDTIFKGDIADGTSTEVFRLDSSASSLLVASTNKIEFNSSNNYIQATGASDMVYSATRHTTIAGGGQAIIEGGSIELDSGGDLILDSDTGAFIAKKGGTEFSATNSAYAGMILGYTRIQNAGTAVGDGVVDIGVDSNMHVLQTVDGTNIGVTFKAPPSGNVEIAFTCVLYTNSTTVAFALSDSTTFNEIDETHTYDAGSVRMDETDTNTMTFLWAVTGLTAGTSYSYYIAGDEISGSTAFIYHGRNRTTGKHWAPIIVKAIALPADGQSPDHFITGE